MTHSIYTQDLTDHKWKDRLILILSEDKDDALVQEQIKEFKKSENDIIDRKLVIYHISPTLFKTILPQSSEWKKNDKLYHKYQKKKFTFEVLLIGLDGRVKLRENQIIKPEVIFSLIDTMPMRKAEMEMKK